MKSLYTLAAAGMFAFSGYVNAASLNLGQIAMQIGGHTICAKDGNDTWQEYHDGTTTSGGDLIDYKRGSGHPTDPTKKVGTWSVTGTDSDAKLTHNYGSGGTYYWAVTSNGGESYNLVGPKNITAIVKAGQVACNF